ncbi:alkane 1-monooxygenase [Bacterioplanoides sp. SCSIO 12839]|uniref:alkane 1-monooxygenase n=1 Tax=Bacterioplanoides sp. SCSIO 12839 TaxID=2829569 RepID=UPI0021067F07|nr:alkane 1-monooxygenase [Bacterioplanoides sp. SCSIO 12839]
MKIFHYLKFFLFHLIGLAALASLFAGGAWISYGLITLLLFYIVGDAISGDDTSTPDFAHPTILTVQLWMALPLLSLIMFASIWSVSDTDVFGIGAWLTQITGYDVLAARENTAWIHHISAFVTSGLMIGLIGTITAHELTHRTWDPISMLVGRWLLAFSFDTIFSIEHVYGHHRYVSTKEDPATAPRGRNVYFHILVSTLKGNISAWNIEKKRLKRKRLSLFGWHNAVIRGHLMSMLLVAAAYAMGGFVAMMFFIACMLWGKSLLEIVNYMEHYGMVRNPETSVQPRHSWNTNKRISSWSMFNLTRHSHHHAQGEVPYQDLKPYPDAPMMISGYLTTIVIALIPPLWHKLMTPKVLEWDSKYATTEELELVKEANAKSGIKAFQQSTSGNPLAKTQIA